MNSRLLFLLLSLMMLLTVTSCRGIVNHDPAVHLYGDLYLTIQTLTQNGVPWTELILDEQVIGMDTVIVTNADLDGDTLARADMSDGDNNSLVQFCLEHEGWSSVDDPPSLSITLNNGDLLELTVPVLEPLVLDLPLLPYERFSAQELMSFTVTDWGDYTFLKTVLLRDPDQVVSTVLTPIGGVPGGEVNLAELDGEQGTLRFTATVGAGNDPVLQRVHVNLDHYTVWITRSQSIEYRVQYMPEP